MSLHIHYLLGIKQGFWVISFAKSLPSFDIMTFNKHINLSKTDVINFFKEPSEIDSEVSLKTMLFCRPYCAKRL